MNVTRKQTRDLREYGFNPLPHQHLVIFLRRLLAPLRILLSAYRKQYLIRFTRRILSRVISVAAVHKDLAACSKLKWQHVQAASVTSSPRQEGELNRDTRSCSQYLHLHPIEVAPFGNALTSKLLTLNYPAARYADVVTDGNREAVKQILGRRVGLLQGQSELMKDAVTKVSHTMKPAAESRTAQHSWHQASLLHKGAARFKIAAEVKSRGKSSGYKFGIGNIASAIIAMTNSFEQIVRDTVERDNIVEHDPLLNSIGVGSEGIFYYSKSFAKCSTSNLD